MNKKKGGFVHTTLLYHGVLVIAWFILKQFLPPGQMLLYEDLIWHLLFVFSGGYLCVYGLIKIFYYEFIYRSGRRLMSKEAQLKREGIDFDHIRQGDDK